MLPRSWINPVPTRFRTPSASRHDARDEHARLRRIEVRDRQSQHVRLHALAHLGDRALRGDAHDLRERERRRALHDRRGGGDGGERHQQVDAMLSDDVVDEILRRVRQNEPGKPVDHHQHQTDGERAAMFAHELARLLPCAGLVVLGHDG